MIQHLLIGVVALGLIPSLASGQGRGARWLRVSSAGLISKRVDLVEGALKFLSPSPKSKSLFRTPTLSFWKQETKQGGTLLELERSKSTPKPTNCWLGYDLDGRLPIVRLFDKPDAGCAWNLKLARKVTLEYVRYDCFSLSPSEGTFQGWNVCRVNDGFALVEEGGEAIELIKVYSDWNGGK